MSAALELGDSAPSEPLIALTEARERTLALVAALTDEELARVHSTLMSPLVWDLGHIAAFEDLWIVHRHGGRPLLREDLAGIYDAFETPRAGRGDLDHLGPAAAREYMAEVRGRSEEVLAEHGPGDGMIPELIVRHEHQHNETMLQTMQLAGLRGFDPTPRQGLTAASPAPTGLHLIDVPAGPAVIGARAEGFAYDNERPRHRIELPAYRIGRFPVTNGDWRAWIEDGGYSRREWWSAEGWAWRGQEHPDRPAAWTEDLAHEWRLGRRERLDPARPVIHVSFHEATAFAAGRGLRLPTEFEWEKAACWDPQPARSVPRGGARMDPAQAGTATWISSRAAPRARAACPAAPRRSDASRCSATSGSGRAASSTAIPNFAHIPTASTPRCSSATATGCCAVAHGRRGRASRRCRSATGTSVSAVRSSPACVSPGTPELARTRGDLQASGLQLASFSRTPRDRSQSRCHAPPLTPRGLDQR